MVVVVVVPRGVESSCCGCGGVVPLDVEPLDVAPLVVEPLVVATSRGRGTAVYLGGDLLPGTHLLHDEPSVGDVHDQDNGNCCCEHGGVLGVHVAKLTSCSK